MNGDKEKDVLDAELGQGQKRKKIHTEGRPAVALAYGLVALIIIVGGTYSVNKFLERGHNVAAGIAGTATIVGALYALSQAVTVAEKCKVKTPTVVAA